MCALKLVANYTLAAELLDIPILVNEAGDVVDQDVHIGGYLY